MNLIVRTGALLLVAAGASGCIPLRNGGIDMTGSLPPTSGHAGPNTSAGSWQMPFQLLPIASVPGGERDSVIAYVPQTGFVKGKAETVSAIGQPLQGRPGANLALPACREVVTKEAAKNGAKDVETVSEGPSRRVAANRYDGPVRFRITYGERNGVYDVREATLNCTVDSKGKIVDAKV
jgi:hypothetical protein